MAEFPTIDTFPVRSLLWLNDASLFIDKELVERFYDAVVRPPHKTGSKKINITKRNFEEIRGKLEIGAEVAPSAGVLGSILKQFLDGKLKVGGEIEIHKEDEKKETSEVVLEQIDTPARKLIQLTIHYLLNHHERLFMVSDPHKSDWRDPDTIAQVPRALIFLDLPGLGEVDDGGVKTMLLPMAAEFTNGEIVTIYQKLIEGLGKSSGDKPSRGDWAWFAERFNEHKAIVAVEKAALGKGNRERGRIRWIDFRVPTDMAGDSLHLHISPSGAYDTGVFAYNFIKRGYKHGVRIVGTLKSGPDMNVLAIYEK